MKTHQKSSLPCLAQNKPSVGMMRLLRQRSHRLLPLLPSGSQHGVAIGKPRGLPFTLVSTHTLGTISRISQTKYPVTKRHPYGCTSSRWAPELMSDLRTPEVGENKHSLVHTHWDPTCLAKPHSMLSSQLHSPVETIQPFPCLSAFACTSLSTQTTLCSPNR